MKAEVRDAWIAALRSGTYTQGKGRLRDADGCMCAQGVLLDISGLGRWELECGCWGYVVADEWAEFHDALGVPGLLEWAGLDSSGASAVAGVVALNDKLNQSFDEIADALEISSL